MSQTVQDKEANMDKKEIAEEEREKMLNEENTKHKGSMEPVNTESEGEEQKPKRKIPIGGIKMPGLPVFCRTKSKELDKVYIYSMYAPCIYNIIFTCMY